MKFEGLTQQRLASALDVCPLSRFKSPMTKAAIELSSCFAHIEEIMSLMSLSVVRIS